MTITVNAALLRSAEVRTRGSNGKPVLTLYLDESPYPFEIVVPVESHSIGEAWARAAPQGTPVWVSGAAPRFVTDHGEARFVLGSLTSVMVGGRKWL